MSVNLSAKDETTGIILKAQKGDQQAFSELVHLYHHRVIDVVYRMCGDSYLADEAAQVAFIKAWKHLPEFQFQSNFRNWIYRIAVNSALDILRKNRPAENIDDVQICSSEGNADTIMEQKERIKGIQEAVLALPEASRAVIVLREYQGLSYREIADTLDISIGTVMSRLNYARTKLADMLADYMEDT